MHGIRALIDAPSRLDARLAGVFRNPTPEELRDLVEERVGKAGSTDEKRADAFGTTRPTLDRWRKSGDVRLSVVAKLAQLSGEAIILRFDPDPEDTKKQAPAPAWAQGLADQILDEIRLNREAMLDALSTTLARELAHYSVERVLDGQPQDEPDSGTQDEPPEAEEQPPAQ